MELLARKYPKGVSFEPMAIRLICNELSLTAEDIEEAKDNMFKVGDRWFSSAMIADVDTILAIKTRAQEWLRCYRYFSVSRLWEEFREQLRNISDPDACSALLQFLGFHTISWQGNFVCGTSQGMNEALKAFSQDCVNRLEEAGGELQEVILLEGIEYIDEALMNAIRICFLPEIYKIEKNDEFFWCQKEALFLPDDFSKQVTTIIDTLIMLYKKADLSSLTLALDIAYQMRVRDEFSLNDDNLFRRICMDFYEGDKELFSSGRKGIRERDICSVTSRSKNENVTTLAEEDLKIRHIIGLKDQILTPATWKGVQRDGNDPKIAEWCKRLDQGETISSLAEETGYAESTLKVRTANHRLYFKLCHKNGITPGIFEKNV